MSVKFTVTPRTQLIDTKTGQPTRDLFRLLEYLNSVASNLSLLVVQDSINNGVTDIAPSQNAVFDAFATTNASIAAVSTDLSTNYTLTSGLVPLLLEDAITNGQASKAPTSNAVFDALALKLDITTAGATYLTIANAAATYLPIATAAATYLTIASAGTTYLPLAGGTLTGPLVLPSYTVATVPDATTLTAGLIYVSDETGGATLAFSDGADWLRVQDRAVIS